MTTPRRKPPTAAPVKRRLPSPERRQQLLEEAKLLFVKHGYHDTTTEKIAEAAGVTEPVLYRHFASKKALFLEVLCEIRHATLERWRTAANGLDDPRRKLQTIADLYLGSTRERALEFRIMHRSLIECVDAEIAEALRAFYLDSEELLATIIIAGQEQGVFRRDFEPRVGAWELIRSALGYTLTLPLDIPLYQERDYLSRAIDFLLQSLEG